MFIFLFPRYWHWIWFHNGKLSYLYSFSSEVYVNGLKWMCVIQLVFSWLISVVQVNINSSNSPFWEETWKAMTIASGRAMISQRRGRYPKVAGANLLFWPFPPKNCIKLKKNGPRRRCTSPVPPLGSTNCRKQVFFPLQQLFSNIWSKSVKQFLHLCCFFLWRLLPEASCTEARRRF